MKRLVFLFIFLLFLAVEVRATQVEYLGPSWYETCDVGVCQRTLYSGNVHMLNEWGDYKPYVNVTKVVYENGKLKIKWNDTEALDNEIDVETALFSQGEKFEPQDFPYMNYTMDIETKRFNYKFNISFNLPRDDLVIALDIDTDFNYILKERSVIIEQHELGFSDAIESNYSISIGTYLNPMDKEIIRINITQDWIGNGTSVNDSVVIDPTVKLQDADSENLEDVFLDEHYPDSNADGLEHMPVGNYPTPSDGRFDSFIKFNISSVPTGVYISNSSLCLFIKSNAFESGDDEVVYVYELDNQTWLEDVVTWNNPPTGIGSLVDSNNTLQANSSIWVYFNVKDWIKSEYDNGRSNVSFKINATQNIGETDRIFFYTKEYTTDTTKRPYLNITYTFNTTLGEISTLNTSLLSETIFRWDIMDNVTIDVNITHDYGGDKLNVTLIEIKNPSGTIKVNNETMTNTSKIVSIHTFEYNYTIAGEEASEGTWTVKIFANDTTDFWDSNSTTFTVGQISKSVPSVVQGDADEGTNVTWTIKSVIINNTMNKVFHDETKNITTLSTCAHNYTIVLLHPNGSSYEYFSNTSEGYMKWTIEEINATQIQRWNITYYTPAPTEDKIGEWIDDSYWYYSFNTTGSCVSYKDVDYTVSVASNASELKLYDNTTGTGARVDTNPDYNWIVSDDTVTFTVPTLSNKTFYISGLVTVSGSITDTTSVSQVTTTPSAFQLIEWREKHHICNPNTFEVGWDDHKIYVPEGAIIAKWDGVEQREIFHDIYGDYFLVDETFDAGGCEDIYLDFVTDGVSMSETYDLPDYITVGEVPKVYIYIDIANPTKYDVENVELAMEVRYGKDVKLYDRKIIVWANAPSDEHKYYKVRDYSIPGAEARIYNIVYTISQISAGTTAEYMVFFRMPEVEIVKEVSAPEIIAGKQATKHILYYKNNAPVKYDNVKYFISVEGLENVIRCSDSDGNILECEAWDSTIGVNIGSLDGQEEGSIIIYFETRSLGFGENIWNNIVRSWDGFVKMVTDGWNEFIYTVLSFFKGIGIG